MGAWRTVGLVFPILAVATGCNYPVAIEALSHDIVSAEPATGAVKPYSRRDPRNRHTGPVLALEFSSDGDLESLATRLEAHHLFFELNACSTNGDYGAELYSGSVYSSGSTDASDEHAYIVYVPLTLSDIVAQASVIGALDVPAELERVRADGLCLSVRGGNMAGFGLESNHIRIPLLLVGDELHVVERVDTRDGA